MGEILEISTHQLEQSNSVLLLYMDVLRFYGHNPVEGTPW